MTAKRTPRGDLHLTEKEIALFWSHVDQRGWDECWPWMGCVRPNGYGNCRYGGINWYPHRLAWAITHGMHDPELDVLHACDAPLCAGGWGSSRTSGTSSAPRSRRRITFTSGSPEVRIAFRAIECSPETRSSRIGWGRNDPGVSCREAPWATRENRVWGVPELRPWAGLARGASRHVPRRPADSDPRGLPGLPPLAVNASGLSTRRRGRARASRSSSHGRRPWRSA